MANEMSQTDQEVVRGTEGMYASQVYKKAEGRMLVLQGQKQRKKKEIGGKLNNVATALRINTKSLFRPLFFPKAVQLFLKTCAVGKKKTKKTKTKLISLGPR